MGDRKLLLERLERLAIVLDELMPQCAELVRDTVALLKEQTQIVKCKDCRYAAPDMACTHESEWGNEISRNRDNPYWFCADGERKNS